MFCVLLLQKLYIYFQDNIRWDILVCLAILNVDKNGVPSVWEELMKLRIQVSIV